MSGLYLLIIVIIWIFLVISITRKAAVKTRGAKLKKIIRICFPVLLMILPVADEISGGIYFKSLCNSEAVVRINIDKARDKEVRLNVGVYSKRHKTLNSIIPITETNYDYYDIKTNEIVLSYKTFSAEGGWLVRLLSVTSSKPPFLFTGFCAPANRFSIFDKYNIKNIDRRM